MPGRIGSLLLCRFGFPTRTFRGFSRFSSFFLGVVKWCFCKGFEKLAWQSVVFLWSFCGEMRGKRWLIDSHFLLLKICHNFQLYFWLIRICHRTFRRAADVEPVS